MLLENSGEDFRSRVLGAMTLVGVLFFVLFARVWYLQVFQGRKFRAFSEQNRITIKRIPAMRGRVLDRHGAVIADSRPSFDLAVTRASIRGPLGELLDTLNHMLQWNDEERYDVERALQGGTPYDTVIIRRDMSRDEVAKVLTRQFLLPGVDIVHSPARAYPYGSHGSHVLGYLGELPRTEFKALKDKGDESYRMGDVWGIAGIEKTYEKDLRGEPGARPFIEDAWGRELGEEISGDLLPAFRPRDPDAGKDLVLAVDLKLQEAAETAFTHDAGAVVALDPSNGDVLALVSRPEYSPENFVRGVSGKYWSVLMKDPLNPLYDRALRGLYAPGSTFKFITGLAALEKQVVDPGATVFCPGSYRLGREVKRCWEKRGHGLMNFHDAVKHSCDVYFYEIGRRLGIDAIASEAKMFGLGKATGIGINREENGLVPDEAWKRRVYKQPWVGGETLSVAIGQGALQVTPTQMAVALAALVNGGTLYRPRLVLRTQDLSGTVRTTFGPQVKSKIVIPEEHRMRMIKALEGVVNEPGGTAYWSGRSAIVHIGGKTGTAQVVGRHAKVQVDDHAWFVAFAPANAPKIVVVVIVENGGHGGTTAAPIAKKVIEAYLGEPS